MKDISNFKNILKNSGWQIGEKILTMLISMFVSAVVARYLGPEQYGLANYVISVVALFTTFSTLGMETITIKDLVHREDETERILGTSFTLRIIGGIALIVASQIALFILNGNNIQMQILGSIMGSCMIFKAAEVIEYYIQSKMKLKVSAIIRFVASITTALFKILIVIFNWGVIGFIFSYLVDVIVIAVLFFIWYNKHVPEKKKWKFSKEYAKELLKRCWYLAIAGLMTTLYMRMDQIMIGYMFEDKSVNGIYSAAVRIAELWYFVPTAIVASFQPTIMKAKMTSQQEFIKYQQRLYDIVAIVGIICVIGISILGNLAVQILYGQEYMEAATILLISVWAGLFATLGTARNPWLISEGLQRYTLIYITAGAVVNLILNSILIPMYGAYGAAIATLIAQIVATVLVPLLLKRLRVSGKMILRAIFNNQVIIEVLRKIKRRLNNEI